MGSKAASSDSAGASHMVSCFSRSKRIFASLSAISFAEPEVGSFTQGVPVPQCLIAHALISFFYIENGSVSSESEHNGIC